MRYAAPSFKPPHNNVKAITLLLLMNLNDVGLPPDGLTAEEISAIAGVKLKTLQDSFPRWIKWRLVLPHFIVDQGKDVTTYVAASKGRAWLERWWNIIPIELRKGWKETIAAGAAQWREQRARKGT